MKFQPSTPGPIPDPVPNARWVPLSRGKYALVDETDYAAVMQWKWTWRPSIPSCPGYAFRTRSFAERTAGLRPINIQMHRFLLNPPTGMEVDHISHDTLDNRRSNLRLATRTQQLQNKRRHTSKKYRFKGVYLWTDGVYSLWQVRIKAEGKFQSLGYFKDDVLAARAYNEAAKKFFGEFACLNVIPEGAVGLPPP